MFYLFPYVLKVNLGLSPIKAIKCVLNLDYVENYTVFYGALTDGFKTFMYLLSLKVFNIILFFLYDYLKFVNSKVTNLFIRSFHF